MLQNFLRKLFLQPWRYALVECFLMWICYCETHTIYTARLAPYYFLHRWGADDVVNAAVVCCDRQTDGGTGFLRAARAGNLDKVLEYLSNSIDIDVCNAVSFNVIIRWVYVLVVRSDVHIHVQPSIYWTYLNAYASCMRSVPRQ